MGTGRGGQYAHTRGSDGRVSCGGRIQATKFMPGKLEDHYIDHRDDFNDVRTPEEYEDKTRKFFDKPATKDILWFEDIDGILYKYDKSKNEFGICRPDGAIITYFKPDRGLKYWREQEAEYGLQEM